MPLEGLETIVTRYGMVTTALAAGGGASFTIWKWAIAPAFNSAKMFVRRANALFDKVDHELNPNGGDSLVDMVNSTGTHFKSIETNALTTRNEIVSRLDTIDSRLAKGDERFLALEKQIKAGVITIQESQNDQTSSG